MNLLSTDKTRSLLCNMDFFSHLLQHAKPSLHKHAATDSLMLHLLKSCIQCGFNIILRNQQFYDSCIIYFIYYLSNLKSRSRLKFDVKKSHFHGS